MKYHYKTDIDTTFCGKPSRNLIVTTILTELTCKKCISGVNVWRWSRFMSPILLSLVIGCKTQPTQPIIDETVPKNVRAAIVCTDGGIPGDIANCGACGTVCQLKLSNNTTSAPTCIAGVCSDGIACTTQVCCSSRPVDNGSRYLVCPNTPFCINTQLDLTNCGSCGHSCVSVGGSCHNTPSGGVCW